ncbi:MAG: tetratricopeptide repeat protein, partial [Sulfurovaceae bacterium]
MRIWSFVTIGMLCFGMMGCSEDSKDSKRDTNLSKNTQEIPGSIKELEKKCNDNDYEACTDLAIDYDYGDGVTQDMNKAAQFYEGVKKDASKSAQLYKIACDGDYALGCYNLGILYDNGTGVEQDKSKAIDLYKVACEGGEPLGCNNLGVMYYNGEGIKKDKAKAIELYEKACQDDEPLGCSNLADIY